VREQHDSIVDHYRIGCELRSDGYLRDFLSRSFHAVKVSDRADSGGNIGGGGSHPDAVRYATGDLDATTDGR
jgi:hypothetical protein